MHGADEPFELLPLAQRGVDVVVVKQTTVRVVDDRVIAERCLLIHEEAHGLAFIIERFGLVEEPVESRRGDHAIRLLIKHDIDDHAILRIHVLNLFQKGQQ